MTFASLAEHGWIGLVLFLLWIFKAQLKMLLQRLVFSCYRTSAEDRNKWLMNELKQDRKMAFARAFFNRASQRQPKPRAIAPRRLPQQRPELVAERISEERESRSTIG